MELSPFLQDLSRQPIIQRLMVVAIYALLAKAVDIFVNRILKRLAAAYTTTDLDDKAIDILHTPIVVSIFFVGILHALSMEPGLSPPWEKFVPDVAKSIALVIWTLAALRLFMVLGEHYLDSISERGKIGADLFLLLKNVVRVVIFVSALLWLLSIWNVNLAPLFASAGIAGIAVALAAKDSLANFFGGISIFADKTFKVGDYIIIDNDQRGEVVEIGVRSTRIMTRDDVLITIPNSILANSKIINESAPVPRFRIRVPVGVAYGSDLAQVEAVLLAVAAANPAVVQEPEARVRMRSFGSSSVDFELLCWVEDPRLKGLEIHNLLKGIYKAFAENKITIPFPQQDVYIKQLPEAGEK
ncbi:mechanosensitive ion channel family protein [Thiovibrio frasassiensis]|uniref:Mechanosensitive ion channel family protein n=1 Tax=Thiovibrio frasassiensis TaxID=2984131 RepID=A0A9X4RLZ2_9BACT|nr:mechanosensitive ion channel family protein [Thiovibrio frasassiensis]MDG4475850.1 mechanosensitive ion channel family protein [Thiovibrio frasassiensis]